MARALINFMLDLHTREHGYLEVEPPFLVNADSLRGTGNLPKFEQDLLQDRGRLEPVLDPDRRGAAHQPAPGDPRRPRAAVALHGLHALLPQRGGSYGADVRGLIRQHQFDKVELMKFSSPSSRMTSWNL